MTSSVPAKYFVIGDEQGGIIAAMPAPPSHGSEPSTLGTNAPEEWWIESPAGHPVHEVLISDEEFEAMASDLDSFELTHQDGKASLRRRVGRSE